MEYFCTRRPEAPSECWHLAARENGRERLGVDVFPAQGFKSCGLTRDGRALQPGVREWGGLFAQYPFLGCMILYPTPNRVRDHTFCYRGRTVVMARHGVPRTEHGLALDAAWTVTDVHADAAAASVTAVFTIRPGDENYAAFPWASRLTARYTLSADGLRFAYEAENCSDAVMPFGIGLHPWFFLYREACNVQLLLPADRYFETTADLLPTGRLLPACAPEVNLNAPQPVRALRLDTVYLRRAGQDLQLLYPEFGFRLRICATPEFRCAVVYTAFAQAPALPGGEVFCAESQTCCTDAINMKEKGFAESGLLELAPGARQTGQIAYLFAELS